jgi:dethiobiotin synthetase
MRELSLKYLFQKEHWIYQLFSAGTGLGKTVFSAGIFQGFLKYAATHEPLMGRKQALRYIKPVQTGHPEDDDSRWVQNHVPSAETLTLVEYVKAVSPHLAAEYVCMFNFTIFFGGLILI